MRARLRLGSLAVAVVGLLAAAAPATAGPVLIDNFSTTTQPQPSFHFTATLSNPQGDAAASSTGFQDILGPASGTIGNVRFFAGGQGAGSFGVGSGLMADTQGFVDNGTNAFRYLSTFSASGNYAFANQYLLAYSVDPALNFSAFGSGNGNPPPQASAGAQAGPVPTTFLASFLGESGIALNFSSVNAAAVGTVFDVAVSDTASHVKELSLTLTQPGPQTIFFPFAAFGPETANGPFGGGGLSGPLDLGNVSGVGVQFTPTPGASFTIATIQASVAPVNAVPEPSSLALLTLGGVALASWRRWKKRKLTA